MGDSLAIWLYGHKVAVVERERKGRLRLTYTEDALTAYAGGTPLLSLALPLTHDRYPNGLTRAFLDGLLPSSGSALRPAVHEAVSPRRQAGHVRGQRAEGRPGDRGQDRKRGGAMEHEQEHGRTARRRHPRSAPGGGIRGSRGNRGSSARARRARPSPHRSAARARAVRRASIAARPGAIRSIPEYDRPQWRGDYGLQWSLHTGD
jgi:HipA-like protein